MLTKNEKHLVKECTKAQRLLKSLGINVVMCAIIDDMHTTISYGETSFDEIRLTNKYTNISKLDGQGIARAILAREAKRLDIDNGFTIE